MSAGKCPVAVLILSCLYIAVGATGFVSHFRYHELVSLQYDTLLIELTELLAVISGAFMLLARVGVDGFSRSDQFPGSARAGHALDHLYPDCMGFVPPQSPAIFCTAKTILRIEEAAPFIDRIANALTENKTKYREVG